MLSHLPILTVILPLVCAPLCLVFSRKDIYARSLLVAVNFITLMFATVMLLHTTTADPMDYALGGWAPPWGIAFRVDQMSALMVFLFAIVFLACALYMHNSLSYELGRKRLYPIYSVMLISQSGLFGIVMTDDLFNIFVLLEMASLSGYSLAAATGSRAGLLSAYRYLIAGTTGALFLLLGIAYIYLLTGTLNLSDLAARLPAVTTSTALLAGYAFIGIGLFLKMALFPLHLWLPAVYAHAPTVIAALFAGTVGKAALYLLIRLFFPIFNVTDIQLPLPQVLLVMGIGAMLFGSLIALRQANLKKMMAYSSIAHVGYIALAISFATHSGMTAGLIHIFSHAVSKSALFLAIGCIVWRIGSSQLSDLHGTARLMPLTCAALIAGGIALIGIPGSANFISKWYLVSAAIEARSWTSVVAIILSSLFAIAYIGRVFEVVYFKPKLVCATGSAGNALAPTDKVSEAPASMLAVTWVLVALSFYIGINPSWLVDICANIAAKVL